jgi:hypothetical protein
MENTSRHLSATNYLKHTEAFAGGTRAEDGEQYGDCPDSTEEQRSRIISAYLQVLEDMRGPIALDSELPCPKEQIGEAILRELAGDPEGDLRRQLEIAYVLLESFIPYEDYRVIEDFKAASRHAQKIADMRDPTSLLRSARVLKRAEGENAVRIQEKIHEKMRKRQLQILKLRERS